MFNLYDLGSSWELVFEHGITRENISGNFTKVATIMIHSLGFEADELDLAISKMSEHSHNVAHFGINRTLIYTFKGE